MEVGSFDSPQIQMPLAYHTSRSTAMASMVTVLVGWLTQIRNQNEDCCHNKNKTSSHWHTETKGNAKDIQLVARKENLNGLLIMQLQLSGRCPCSQRYIRTQTMLQITSQEEWIPTSLSLVYWQNSHKGQHFILTNKGHLESDWEGTHYCTVTSKGSSSLSLKSPCYKSSEGGKDKETQTCSNLVHSMGLFAPFAQQIFEVWPSSGVAGFNEGIE